MPNEALCCYCKRPVTLPVRVVDPTFNRLTYCSRLCTAFAMISLESQENQLTNETCEFDVLLESALENTLPIKYPVKVRYEDAEEGQFESFGDERSEEEFLAIGVIIDDDKTPDWIPTEVATEA